jgi:hypothetical protein
MEEKKPQPEPTGKFAEVKKKAAELRAKKQAARAEADRAAAQIARDETEDS